MGEGKHLVTRRAMEVVPSGREDAALDAGGADIVGGAEDALDAEYGAKSGFKHAGDMRDLCWKIQELVIRRGNKTGKGRPVWQALGWELGEATKEEGKKPNRVKIYRPRRGLPLSSLDLQALARIAHEDERTWLIAGRRLTPGLEHIEENDDMAKYILRLATQLVYRKRLSKEDLDRGFAALAALFPDRVAEDAADADHVQRGATNGAR